MATVFRFDVLRRAVVPWSRQLWLCGTRKGANYLPDTPTTAELPPTPFLNKASFAHPLAFPTRLTPLFKCSRLSHPSFLMMDLSSGEARRLSSEVSTPDEEEEGVLVYSAGQMREEMVRRKSVGMAV